MKVRKLGRKQTEDNSYWVTLWNNIHNVLPIQYVRNLVETTAEEIRKEIANKKVAYGWSGGKDSQALRAVCELAGIGDCLLGMCNLEYPEFLRWVTDNMPWELEVINTGQDIEWLSKNQHLLFPQDSTTAAKWFKMVQHTAQEQYYKKHNLDMVLLGRRKQDSNFTGYDGTGIYTNKKGITRFSPIREWTHEEVMAVCYYYGYELAPCYRWPNGFVVGSGNWAARQWTGSVQGGWREVWQIDRDIVKWASSYIDSAQQFLDNRAKRFETFAAMK